MKGKMFLHGTVIVLIGLVFSYIVSFIFSIPYADQAGGSLWKAAFFSIPAVLLPCSVLYSAGLFSAWIYSFVHKNDPQKACSSHHFQSKEAVQPKKEETASDENIQ